MRILICTFEYPPVGSGIANVAYNLRNEFAKHHDVAVCSPVGPDVKLGSWGLISRTGGIGILHYWWLTGRWLQRHINEFDAVLLENPLLFHRISNPRIRITTHTTYGEYFDQVKDSSGIVMRLYYRFMRRIERRLYKILDKNIPFTSASDCVSEELAKLGIAPEKIRYISNGADVRRFKPVAAAAKKRLRAKHGLADKTTLLFVGRLEQQHQPIEMVRIFARCRKEQDCQLVVVGTGSLEHEVHAAAERVQDIVFIPMVEYTAIHEVFQAADAFLLNSLYTGQSLAMLEAVASGLPLLVPDITEFRRIVHDSGVGLLYPPADPEAAGGLIASYLGKANISAESRRLRKYAEQKVDWAEIAKRYLEYFSARGQARRQVSASTSQDGKRTSRPSIGKKRRTHAAASTRAP